MRLRCCSAWLCLATCAGHCHLDRLLVSPFSHPKPETRHSHDTACLRPVPVLRTQVHLARAQLLQIRKVTQTSPRQTTSHACHIRAGGAASIITWGALGSAQAGLPITKGPQTGGENGKGGKSGRL